MDGIVQAERQTTFVIMASKYSTRAWVTLTILVLNAVGAVGYLVLASNWWWAIPEEHGEIPITGQPFVWAAATAEILLPFLVLDLAWAAFIIAKKHWQDGRLLLVAPLIWLAAIVIDFAHH